MVTTTTTIGGILMLNTIKFENAFIILKDEEMQRKYSEWLKTELVSLDELRKELNDILFVMGMKGRLRFLKSRDFVDFIELFRERFFALETLDLTKEVERAFNKAGLKVPKRLSSPEKKVEVN